MASFDLPALDRHKYPPMGWCIYCGTKDGKLTTEHIVPFGLGGNLELPESSCESCARITSQFETDILRGELWATRVFLELQSRRKHKTAPTSWPLTVVKDGKEEVHQLPIESYPVLAGFVNLPPPRYLSGQAIRPGLDARGMDTISLGISPQEVLRKFGAQSIRIKASHSPVNYARMLAKIAYSMAAATGALQDLAEPSPLVPAILGHEDTIGHWVGSIDEPNEAHAGQLHRVAVVSDHGRGLLIGDVQLFSASPTPRYGVILGRLKSGLPLPKK